MSFHGWWQYSTGNGTPPRYTDAISMADQLLGPTPGVASPGKDGGKGKPNACGNGCGVGGKGKSAESMTAPSCKARFTGGRRVVGMDHDRI